MHTRLGQSFVGSSRSACSAERFWEDAGEDGSTAGVADEGETEEAASVGMAEGGEK